MKIRVLSYNIHKGFDWFNFRFTLHEIKRAISEANADICLLQEVVGENIHHSRRIKEWPTSAQFEFLADTIWPHFSYGKNAIYDGRHHGNAILSKFPILLAENINISTNKWEQRGLLHCEVDLPETHHKLHIFNVHLNLLAGGRRLQLDKIVARARSHVPPNTPFLIGGDFNDWSERLSPKFHEFLGLHESFRHHQGNHARSFPSFFPFLPLDRLYFRDLEIIHTTTLREHPWSVVSDHIPLLVEFTLPG